MKEANRSPRAATTYMVAKSAMRGGEVFREYALPGGATARVLDKDIFSEAVRRGSRVLEEISAKHSRAAGSMLERPSGSKGGE